MKPLLLKVLTKEKTFRLTQKQEGLLWSPQNLVSSCHAKISSIKKRNCTCGQALMETLFVLPVITVTLGALLTTLYLCISTALIDHWVYQSSICLARQSEKIQCQNRLENHLNTFVFHKTTSIDLSTTDSGIDVWLITQTPLHTQKFEAHLKLPLIQKGWL